MATPNPSLRNYADNLIAWRENKRLSQKELADILGVKPEALCRLEKCQRVSSTLIFKLAVFVPALGTAEEQLWALAGDRIRLGLNAVEAA